MLSINVWKNVNDMNTFGKKFYANKWCDGSPISGTLADGSFIPLSVVTGASAEVAIIVGYESTPGGGLTQRHSGSLLSDLHPPR